MVRIFQRNDRSLVGWRSANPSGGENRPDSDIYFISTEGYLYDSKNNIRYIQCYRSACE
jgi:hypothetical protein